MKRLTATLAICALLGAPVGAFATPGNYTWNGGSSHVWGKDANWDGFPSPPPGTDSGDTAFIDDGTSNQPEYTSASGSKTVAVLTLDGNSVPETVSLILSGGTLTVSGLCTVQARLSGTPSHPATLNPTADLAIAPNTLFFSGDEDSHAIGDFDADVTVGASSASTRAIGYVDIDVQDADADVFLAKEMFVGDTTGDGTGDAFAYVTLGSDSGAGEVRPTALKILPGDAANEDATVDVKSGKLDVQGELLMVSGATADRQAKFLVQATADPVTVDTMDIDGPATDISSSYAWLDFRDNVSVDGSTGPHTSFDGFVDVDLAASVTFDAKEMVIADSLADFQVTGANITTSILKYDSLTTNLGTIRFIGPLTVQEYD